MATYRLLPRYRWLATAAGLLGLAIAVVGFARSHWTLCGIGGFAIVLGAAYLLSPSWRIRLVTSEDALEFAKPNGTVDRIAWTDIKRLLIAGNQTCLLVGTTAKTSLIVPGLGAPAPYDIENKAALFAEIVARVPVAAHIKVDSVESAIAAKLPWSDPVTPG
jgi:hypothetical protein